LIKTQIWSTHSTYSFYSLGWKSVWKKC
jgi:hypothetical protein